MAHFWCVWGRGLQGSKNSLHGTDPDPYFIWKWDPNPCRPEKCLKCTTRTRPLFKSWTRTRLGRHRPDCTRPDRHIGYCTANAIKSMNKLRKKQNLFALTTVSSPLPDCDAYNPLCQYISIHVRLFLSLADWNSLLNPLVIPASKVYLLRRRRILMQLRSLFFFISSQLRLLRLPFWTSIPILFVGCNKDSEQYYFF